MSHLRVWKHNGTTYFSGQLPASIEGFNTPTVRFDQRQAPQVLRDLADDMEGTQHAPKKE